MTPGEEAALAFVADLAKDVEAEVLKLRADKERLVEAMSSLINEAIHFRNNGVGPQFLSKAIDEARLALLKAAQS
jgi:hypothetical protein